MIDVIVNEHGGLTVAHDDRQIDGLYDRVEIHPSGEAHLAGRGEERRRLGVLAAPMMELVAPGMAGRIIRTSGLSVARVSPLAVVILPA